MKHYLAPLALLLSLPTLVWADPVLYGKGNLSLQHTDENGDSAMELVSHNSRIGVKGAETLSDGLEAIYQLEYGTRIDDGGAGDNTQTFTQRDIYLGVRGEVGTLMAGRVNTPLKTAQNKVDLFNDLEGDINYLFAGEVRASNVVQYLSPTLNNAFAGKVAYITYEEDGADPGVSASGSYERNDLYLAVAADSNVQGQDTEALRLVGRYSFDRIHLGALFETADDGVSDEDGAFVSVLWEATELWSLKAQAGRSDIEASGGESVSLGADYKLSDNTKLFGYYTSETNDLDCPAGGDCDSDYLGAGITLSF